MTKLSVLICALAMSVALIPAAYSAPITCTLATPPPPLVPSRGESELVEDVLMTCASSAPSQSISIDVELFLNVNVTSRITNTTTLADEALLLIDDPKPGVSNTSNGFTYIGQVLGTPGVLAGAPGSGNVYQGAQAMSGGVPIQNAVVFVGVPYVTGGTRTFRLTNIRADVAAIGVNPVNADVAITSNIAISITNPEITVAYGASAMKFTYGPIAGAPGLDLSFAELFPSAFKKRIENTLGGPLTVKHQDEPGTVYCTESGFTPGFVTLTSHAIGFADTGLRLLAVFQGIPAGVTTLTVPNQVTSSSGALVAHRVLPPLGTHFAAGTVTTSTGSSTVTVTATHTAELLYDVTAASPYLGVNGCGALDTFNIGVFPSPPMSITSTVVTGFLAPIENAPEASATAPEPRFLP